MTVGQWQLNGQPIVFNGRRCLDGQHRLHAVVQSGQSVPMLIVRGVSEDAFVTLDTGRKRQASDVLSIAGHSNVVVLASSANLALQYLAFGSMYTNSKNRFSTQDISSFADANRHELAVAYDVAIPSKAIIGLPSLVVALAFLVRSHQKCVPFFGSVADGLNLTKVDPVHHLRDRFISDRSNRVSSAKATVKAAWLVKAWNAYASDRPMALLRWNAEQEQFPEIVGCAR
jgi:hypothetical protein